MKLAYAFRKSTFYPYRGRDRALPPAELRQAYLSKVRSLGYEGIELSLDSLGGVDCAESTVVDLRRELEDSGLPCVAVRCRGSLKDEQVAEENRELLKKGVQAAQWIGAEILDTTVTSPAQPDQPGDFRGQSVSQGSSRMASDADFDATAQWLTQVADMAADSGVSLSIELHHNSIVDNSWSALRMLKLVDRPNVGLNPDIKNIYWAYDEPEESSEDAILALAPHAIYWHCKNVTRIPLPKEGYTVYVRNSLPDGEIDYRFAVAAMFDAGYNGYLAIEGHVYGDQLYIDGRSAAYAKSLIEELGGERKES